MAANTKVEWARHSFSPWIGCSPVSVGCQRCYAQASDARFFGGGHWGPGRPRLRRSDAYWADPLKWERAAAVEGVRHRVFCSSMADVFDSEALLEERWRLWPLIDRTPHLDWLLLTKRPENLEDMLPAGWAERPAPNVWLGVTAEDQARVEERLPLLATTATALRFVSVEPMLEPVNLLPWLQLRESGDPMRPRIGWVICGGESGPGARPMDLGWVRELRDQCARAVVPFLFKQRIEERKKISLPVLDGRTHDAVPGVG